jgi:hypothetical protein
MLNLKKANLVDLKKGLVLTLESGLSKEYKQTKILPIQRVLDKISDKLNEAPLGQPHFADIRYVSRDFSTRFFNSIPNIHCDLVLGFVDGGNAPVYSSANLAIHLTRVYFNLFKNGERINPKYLPQRIEFYTLCYVTAEESQIFYETELVPVFEEWTKYLPDVSGLKFDSFDPSLRIGNLRAPIRRIAETVRLFAEWKIAGLMCEYEMDEGDALVRDGTLQTSVTNERVYSNEAMNRAKKNNVILLGLAKTSTLFTSTGFPLFAAIAELAEGSSFRNDAWYYYPIVDINQPDHRAEMYAVKLHSNSEYVFRLEVLKDQAKMMNKLEIEKYICALSECSKDACFPGYPYGLIDADRFARISGIETFGQNLQFLSCASSSGVLERLKRCLKTSDAHELLNKIVGGQKWK